MRGPDPKDWPAIIIVLVAGLVLLGVVAGVTIYNVAALP